MLGKAAEKYKTFSVSIEKKVTNIDKVGNESVATLFYKRKFINSARFMASYLSILLIISQKEFTKLSVTIVIIYLNMKVSNTIWWNVNAYLAIKVIQTKLMKN